MFRQRKEDEKRTSDLFSLSRKLLRFTHVLVAHLCRSRLKSRQKFLSRGRFFVRGHVLIGPRRMKPEALKAECLECLTYSDHVAAGISAPPLKRARANQHDIANSRATTVIVLICV